MATVHRGELQLADAIDVGVFGEDDKVLYLEKRRLDGSGGIIEVMPHLVTILADTALRADDIDEAAAIRARDEARRALENRRGEMEIAEALARLAEAMNKLEALEQLRKLSRIRR